MPPKRTVSSPLPNLDRLEARQEARRQVLEEQRANLAAMQARRKARFIQNWLTTHPRAVARWNERTARHFAEQMWARQERENERVYQGTSTQPHAGRGPALDLYNVD